MGASQRFLPRSPVPQGARASAEGRAAWPERFPERRRRCAAGGAECAKALKGRGCSEEGTVCAAGQEMAGTSCEGLSLLLAGRGGPLRLPLCLEAPHAFRSGCLGPPHLGAPCPVDRGNRRGGGGGETFRGPWAAGRTHEPSVTQGGQDILSMMGQLMKPKKTEITGERTGGPGARARRQGRGADVPRDTL